MATQQAPQRQPRAPNCAMPFNSLERVRRTGRMKPAAWSSERTDRVLIGTDHRGKDSLHRSAANRRSMSPLTDPISVGRAPRRTSRSFPASRIWLRLNHSRKRRRTRFLSTARGSRRLGTTSPNRGKSRPFGRTWTEITPALRGLVAASTWAIASEPSRCALRYRSVRIKRPAEPALSHAARGSLPCRHGCASGPGNRACACDGRQTAGKCASLFFPSITKNLVLDDGAGDAVNARVMTRLWITHPRKSRIQARLTCPRRPRLVHARILAFLPEPIRKRTSGSTV